MSSRVPDLIPGRRLGALYFGYFGALGALVPYFSRYLAARGYDAATIGQLMAVLSGTRVFAPFLWSLVIERVGLPMAVVRAALVIATLSFAGLLLEPAFLGLLLCLLGYHLFANAVLPQMEAVTLGHLREKAARYSRIRMWGSVGYMGLVVVTGFALDRMGATVLPVLVLAGLLFTIGAAVLVPDVPSPEHASEAMPIGPALRHLAVWALIGISLLQQAANMPYYLFYDLLLKGHGYSGFTIGCLIALGVLAEIGMFFVVGRMLERHGPRLILLAVLAIGTFRWLAIGGLTHSLVVLALAQLLHAVTFAAAHATAMYSLARLFPSRLQVRAQGLYASLVYGVGGITGSLLAGQIGKVFGLSACFYLSSVLSILALLWTWHGFHIDRRPVDDYGAA